ncbi:hypothetical protein [Natrarchaeobius oligotrophus]|nr:hypothetical protein [Natrarchaeobius chitinivorans]
MASRPARAAAFVPLDESASSREVSMTGCFWADDPFESVDPGGADEDGPTRCPRCGTPIAIVSSTGPTTHVATPCGCRVPGDVLEHDGDEP